MQEVSGRGAQRSRDVTRKTRPLRQPGGAGNYREEPVIDRFLRFLARVYYGLPQNETYHPDYNRLIETLFVYTNFDIGT